MPRVIRALIIRATEYSEWNPEYAIAKVLEEAGESQVQETIDFLSKLRVVTPQYKLDVGRMQVVSNDLRLQMDLHDCIDRFVRCGIMSACTQSSLHSGLAAYEINRCLYWSSAYINAESS